MTRVFLLPLAIILSLGARGQVCLDDWTNYRDEACVFFYHWIVKTWTDSRSYCLSASIYKQDLIQIFDEDKERFVTEHFARALKRWFWLGIRDTDGDGTLEYFNGSKLVASPGGLGNWPESTTYLEKNSCGYRTPTSWRVINCDKKMPIMCEYLPTKPGPYNAYLTPNKDIACQSETCKCEKENWVHYSRGNKYLRINKVSRTFHIAQNLCQALGGQLLTIPDSNTQSFVEGLKKWWGPKNVFYWIGLDSTLSAKRTLSWVDGKDVKYSNWLEAKQVDNTCAAVIWDGDAKWRWTDCASTNFHICEAAVPCDFQVVIYVNGGPLLKNGSVVDVLFDQEVSVACGLGQGGHFVPTVELNMSCSHPDNGDDVVLKRAVGKKVVDESVRVDIGMSCWCRAADGNLHRESFRLVLNVKPFSPRLVNSSYNHRVIPFERRVPLVEVAYDIYAQPMPMTYKLTKRGRDVDVTDYIVTFESQGKEGGSLKFSLVVLILAPPHVDCDSEYAEIENRKGPYRLTLDNGEEHSTHLVFRLHGDDAPWYHCGGMTSRIMLLVIFGIAVPILLVVMFASLFLVNRASIDKAQDLPGRLSKHSFSTSEGASSKKAGDPFTSMETIAEDQKDQKLATSPSTVSDPSMESSEECSSSRASS